jgi:hypothetical protein
VIQNWIATWGYRSLENRIGKLEGQLADLDRFPTISEVEDQILWGIQALRVSILSASSGIIVIVMAAVDTFAKNAGMDTRSFTGLGVLILTANLVNSLIMRYSKGFWHQRSPRVRAGFAKSIAELKRIHANWGKAN